MTSQADDQATSGAAEPVRYTVLSRRAITLWAALIMVVGVGMALWLLLAYGSGDPRNQLDAIRTAGTVVVGTGGAAALLLAARRQRATEIALQQKDRDQRHQEQVAKDTRDDAAERRITELYTKAAEQLGSTKAPVRLAGLYALERLGQNTPTQRQTIVNVICAYLRMPFLASGEPSLDDSEPATQGAHHEQVQEREVRLTAQGILAARTRPGPGGVDKPVETFWPDLDLDLRNATLISFDLQHRVIRNVSFRSATFEGNTNFALTTFTGNASFVSATFTKDTFFRSARFEGTASFRAAEFQGSAVFRSSCFGGTAVFRGTIFSRKPHFSSAEFADGAPDEIAPFLNESGESLA